MSHAVPRVDLEVYKGATYRRRYEVRDENDALVSLSGYTAKLQMRPAPGGAVLYTADTTPDLTVDVAGYVDLELPAATSEAWAFDTCQYDLMVLDVAAKPFIIARGTVVARASITDAVP